MIFAIKYCWPNGKVRYRKGTGLCLRKRDADVFTEAESRRIIVASSDAKLVWGITTRKVKCSKKPSSTTVSSTSSMSRTGSSTSIRGMKSAGSRVSGRRNKGRGSVASSSKGTAQSQQSMKGESSEKASRKKVKGRRLQRPVGVVSD